MDTCRFLYANLASDPASLTLSSARPGVVGMPAPLAAGAATAYAGGAHTGALDQVFRVEIDSVAAGAELGQATFRWRREQSATWEASGLPTSAVLTALADGVAIKWVGGEGDDFVAGDAWTIHAARAFGAAALADGDRDTCWETTGCATEHLSLDLGSPQAVRALVLADHNLSAAASVSLLADDGPDWTQPAHQESLGVTTPHLVAFPELTYRHYRLTLSDPANPDGVLKASLLYLGDYFAPRRNFRLGHTQSTEAGRSLTATDAGKLAGGTWGLGEKFSLSFGGVDEADLASFLAMFKTVHGQGRGRLRPLFFTPCPARPAATYYCLPAASLERVAQAGGRYSLSLSLEEMVRSHA